MTVLERNGLRYFGAAIRFGADALSFAARATSKRLVQWLTPVLSAAGPLPLLHRSARLTATPPRTPTADRATLRERLQALRDASRAEFRTRTTYHMRRQSHDLSRRLRNVNIAELQVRELPPLHPHTPPATVTLESAGTAGSRRCSGRGCLVRARRGHGERR